MSTPAKQHKFWPQQKKFVPTVSVLWNCICLLWFHPSKDILNAEMLHQDELTVGFKYTRWLRTSHRCANTLANQPQHCRKPKHKTQQWPHEVGWGIFECPVTCHRSLVITDKGSRTSIQAVGQQHQGPRPWSCFGIMEGCDDSANTGALRTKGHLKPGKAWKSMCFIS